MKNRIYFFSGTGNTLFAAKLFAEKLGDTELVAIADLNRLDEVVLDGLSSVGFFFPVYCFGIPNIVQAFLSRINKAPEDVYVYSLCTCGGMKGSASLVLEDVLKKKGITLSAAFSITMPSNYIPLSEPPPERRIAAMMEDAKKDIEKFVQTVKAGKTDKPLRVFPFDMFGELVCKSAVAYMGDYDKYFWLTDACDGCEICEKVCPASNIIIMNKMPTWRGHCEQCMACLQWCPKQAIQFKKITLKRERYHNPAVDVKEMFRNIFKDGSRSE